MIEQEDISYIDEAPQLNYGVNIVKDLGSDKATFHIFTDNGYAMYRGPISYSAEGKVITDKQKDLYNHFAPVLDKWANVPAYLKVRSNPTLSNVRPLAYVYNVVFDLTFRHWINQMLAYCTKNALIILPDETVPSKIDEAIVVDYDRHGNLVFYGEFVCDEETKDAD